jgi:hypothetical protein
VDGVLRIVGKGVFVGHGARTLRALRRLRDQSREIAALRAALARVEAGDPPGVRPENIVWIFGSGRTGSSWLSFMMGSLSGHARWNEPLIGYLFGHLYHERGRNRRDTRDFILGDGYADSWLGSVRGLLLDGAVLRFPGVSGGGYLVIKEPHGSVGAPLLMRAVPESRMIFLIRDPRDVAASSLDAHKGGSRPSRRRVAKRPELFRGETGADRRPDAFVRAQARTYRQDITLTAQAYEAHEGRKVLVRYEDLRADTLGVMKRIYSALEIPVAEDALVRSIERHAWENISEEEKGEGRIRRKARPGGWKEDLTPEQARIVEEETAQILDRFYPGG